MTKKRLPGGFKFDDTIKTLYVEPDLKFNEAVRAMTTVLKADGRVPKKFHKIIKRAYVKAEKAERKFNKYQNELEAVLKKHVTPYMGDTNDIDDRKP